MENNKQQAPPDQLNPGQNDQFGNEAVVKKNEGISDQGNEWSDQEGIHEKGSILGEKAEKYIKDSADVEDMPEEEDEKAADASMEQQAISEKPAAAKGDDPDDVIEPEDEYVPGYDLGRNKVQ